MRKRIKVSLDNPRLDGWMIDMIRRISPSTIASQLVGVQPMSQPSGLIYDLRKNRCTI